MSSGFNDKVQAGLDKLRREQEEVERQHRESLAASHRYTAEVGQLLQAFAETMQAHGVKPTLLTHHVPRRTRFTGRVIKDAYTVVESGVGWPGPSYKSNEQADEYMPAQYSFITPDGLVVDQSGDPWVHMNHINEESLAIAAIRAIAENQQ